MFDDIEPTWVEVDTRRVRVERSRQFDDVWLAMELMKKLGLTECFHQVLPSPRAKNEWAEMAMILVAARFCDAHSELSIADDGRELRLRRVAKPEKPLAFLLQKLKLIVPDNIDHITKM